MGSLTKKKNKAANTGLDRARQVPPPRAPIQGAFEISINNSTSGGAYVGWTLSSCSIRITNQPQPALNVILKNRDTTRGGQVVFRTAYAAAEQNTLALTLPGDGTPVPFFVGGKLGSPSTDDQDGGIAVTDAATSNVLHERTLMVRVRKNANTLTIVERDRFLEAYAALNAVAAIYQVFLDSHNAAADREIHGRAAFLPWHRAFVLSLERQLQAIDASVAAHYWRFDQPSPNIFTEDFMGGSPNSVGRLTFSSSNPMRVWSVSGVTGVIRLPRFNTGTDGALVQTESATLLRGPGFRDFRVMEGDPHGFAHTSFSSGPLTSPPTATQDPLFFLLHSNVDRLWAKWQRARNLYDASNTDTYSPAATPGELGPRAGDFLADTMWPWNGVTGGGRPPTAPGGPLPQLPFPSKPGPLPTVGDVIDYVGKTQGNTSYFDYDDVPFP